MKDLTDDMDSGMDPAAMQSLYAKALYRLRESRKALLNRYGVSDEAQLLDRIRAGEVSEHPAYEHYLSALIMEQGRQQLREEMLVRFGSKAAEEVPAISVHMMLQERLEEAYANRLTEPVALAQDALLLSFDTGLMMEARYFSKEEFSLQWSWGEAELRLDTAPVHGECKGFPRHLHRDDGTVVEDPVGVAAEDPWEGISRLLDVLLVDPLLDNR
ncbi:hypothetical protein [Noviherbaspirillum sp. ST9]|uniref:hypothetical protein n=1 Tax=Noviherbaspirillum sp. ST9 TaxID=3401606 RepID=UPI003B58A8A9